MAPQLGALRAALIDAGASDKSANKAAEELAGYQSEFSKVYEQFASVRGEINLLRWMMRVNLALTLAVFVRLFVH